MNRRKLENGVALILVIVVLMALVIIATPFAVSMQLQEKTSRSFVHETQARMLAEGARNYAVSQLMQSHESCEKTGKYDAPYNTPDWDTIDEFSLKVDLPVIAGRKGLSFLNPKGLMWSVSASDEQAKININASTPWLIGNLMGAAVLAEPLSAETATVIVDDARGFYTDGDSDTIDGYLWIDGEVISYKSVSGNTFSGCERGCFTDNPEFAKPAKHKEKNLVIDFRAYKLSGHPVRAEQGRFAPFDNLSSIKDLSAYGNSGKIGEGAIALTPSEIDYIKPYLTVYSRPEVAGQWTAPVRIFKVIGQDQTEVCDALEVSTGRNLSPGTFVRVIREKTDSDPEVEYARVLKVKRGQNLWIAVLDRKLATKFEEDDEGYVQTQVRPPVNVNTASRAVLLSLFTGVKFVWDEGMDNPETGEEQKPSRCVTREEAVAVVSRIFARSDSGQPLRCHEDFVSLLNECFSAGELQENSLRALEQNALNPHHHNFSVSTAPLCYKSSDTYTIEATGIVNLESGRQAAIHRIEEVIELSPPTEASLSLESQYDFQKQISSPQGRLISAWPNPVGVRDVYPSYSRTIEEKGDVRLQSSRMYEVWSQVQQVLKSSGGSGMEVKITMAGGEGAMGYVEHFDRQLIEGFKLTPDGPDLDGKAITFGDDKTKFVPDTGNDSKDYMAGSVEFWYMPKWPNLDDNHVLFDTAEVPGRVFRNRIMIFFDSDMSELVLHVADGTEEETASQVRWIVDKKTLKKDTWYHIAASWKGTRVGELGLLVDGKPVGRFVHRTSGGDERFTTLSSDIDPMSLEIPVESTQGFPDRGVLVIGKEAITYTSKTATSFVYQPYPEFVPPDTASGGSSGSSSSSGNSIHGPVRADRQDPGSDPAVLPTSGTYDVKTNRGKRGTKWNTHPSGSAVTIYGYTSMLETRLPIGGGTFANESMGPDTTTRLVFPGEEQGDGSGSGSGGGSSSNSSPKSSSDGFFQGPPGGSITIVMLAADADEIKLKNGTDFPDHGFVLIATRKQAATGTGSGSGSGGSSGGGSGGGGDGIHAPGGTGSWQAGSTDTGTGGEIQYEFAYYAKKDEHDLKDVKRGQLGSTAQEFAYEITLGTTTEVYAIEVWLVSVAATATDNYLDKGRLQIDNEWFIYDSKTEMDGKKYFVRNEIIEDLNKNIDKFRNSKVDEKTGAITPPDESEETPEITFREAHRTIGASHATSAKIIPVFEVKDIFAGRFDDVTFLSSISGAQMTATGMVNWADGKYVALADNVGSEILPLITRVLKFPSGELPSKLGKTSYLGGSTPGGSGASSVATRGRVDEARFTTASRGIFQLSADIDKTATELVVEVHPLPGKDDPGDLPLNIPSDGGIIKIANEYVGYTELDGYTLKGLKRGMLGSEAAIHSNGAYIMHMAFMTVTSLTEEAGSESNLLRVKSAAGFPNEGYVLIDKELVGYTHAKQNADLLAIASRTADSPGAFRGAFGTQPATHPSGDLLVLIPHRYHDRYRPETDLPESAFFQASFSARDAIWQEILWEEEIEDPLVQDVVFLVRVDGMGRWDDKPANTAGGIYRFDSPELANIIAVQGDFIEVRACFEYKKGAFEGSGWKGTPKVWNLRVKYTQPMKVLHHKELGGR